MPRKSPCLIDLTKGERAELEARSRDYTSPYRDVVRARIVLLASQGLGTDRIAARLDMPCQIVSKSAGAFMPSGYLVSKNYCRWLRRRASNRRGEHARLTSPAIVPLVSRRIAPRGGGQRHCRADQ